MSESIKARLPQDDGSFKAVEIIFDEKIEAIKELAIVDSTLPIVMPGFIDLHVHGAGGADVMDAKDSLSTIAKTLIKYGTTSFLATTMTAPFEQLEKAFLDMRDFYQHPKKHHARLLGVHLEGPFISADKLGAQPHFTRAGSLEEIKHLHNLVPIKVITLAPEIKDNLDLIEELTRMGMVVQVGHSNASYEQAKKALDLGAQSFTHLYNAMSGLHHRAPGVVGAALAHADYAECIPDLQHVHPGAIHCALRAIPHLYFVTDSTAATGMPEGEYQLGSQRVSKCANGVRLADGTLAGSCLTMDQALKNLLSLGLDYAQCAKRLSTIAAKLVGHQQLGVIGPQALADFLLLDNEARLLAVYKQGQKYE